MNKIKKGPFEVLSSIDVYKNPWLRVHEDKVKHENGKEGIFGIVEMKSGSTVLALTDKFEVYLVKEYKYGINIDSIELMSGGLDGTELPIEGAKRELKEELGLIAKKWIDLGLVNPFTTIINSPNYMFLAIDLENTESKPDEWEKITQMKVPLKKVIEMVMNSEITHSASVVCVLKAVQYLKNNKIIPLV